jgi:hypothetical protein
VHELHDRGSAVAALIAATLVVLGLLAAGAPAPGRRLGSA